MRCSLRKASNETAASSKAVITAVVTATTVHKERVGGFPERMLPRWHEGDRTSGDEQEMKTPLREHDRVMEGLSDSIPLSSLESGIVSEPLEGGGA